MRVVELFSGIGVSSCGMKAAGANVVGACEIESKFVHAYNSQNILNPVATAADVDDYEVPECDLLSGGPVCKAFSPGAGLFGTKGKDDVRNTFPHFFRALDRCDPQYVLVENSYGLRRFSDYLSDIIKELQRRGYYTDCSEIDCYDYGVPQHRHRVVMLGSKGDPWYVTKPVDRDGPLAVGGCLGAPPKGDKLPLTRPMTDKELAYWRRDPKRERRHPPLRWDRAAGTVVSNYKRGVPYGVVVREDGGMHMCNPRLAARLMGVPDEYDVNVLPRTKMLEGLGNGFPAPVVRHLVGALTSA